MLSLHPATQSQQQQQQQIMASWRAMPEESGSALDDSTFVFLGDSMLEACSKHQTTRLTQSR